MKPNLGYRAQAALLLTLVAIFGALTGVIVDRVLAKRVTAGAPAPNVAFRPPPDAGLWRWEPRPDARFADRLASRLGLSDEQRAEINRILAEEQTRVRALTRQVQPQFRQIAEQTRSRIDNVLTEEQRTQLGELREERMRGRRFRGRMEEGPPRRR